MKSERNYGIDLLRLVLMFMVCMLHTLGQGGVLSTFNIIPSEKLSCSIFWFLEVFSFCAVDGFAIISGYVAKNRPRKYEKLVEMWFQAFFYSFILSVILTLIGLNPNWTFLSFIRYLFPITFNLFWYFTSFFGLYFLIPMLNKFLFSLNEKDSKKALIVIFGLFSCIGIVYDSFMTQWGYSLIWLTTLYCIGVLAKKANIFKKQKTITLVIILYVSIYLTWLSYIVSGYDRLINYISPTILLSALLMVIIFSRIHLKGTIISKLSPLAFGIYLFQLNPVIWHKLEGAFMKVISFGILKQILYVFLAATCIFVTGLVVEFIRSVLARKMKIPSLSKKIVLLINKILEKVIVVLR